MKTISQLSAILFLCCSVIRAHAIEGLTLTIQDVTNVVLAWPSVEGANYIVQHRATLDTNDTWQTLTNYYPAFSGTNVTEFVHVDAVCYPAAPEGGGGGGGLPDPEDFASSESSESTFEDSLPPMPPLPWDSLDWGDADKEDFNSSGGESAGDSDSESSACFAFYRVVKHGVEITASTVSNLTSSVLSGTIPVAFEAGHDRGRIDAAVLIIDGQMYSGDGVLSAPVTHPWLFQFDTAFLENGEHYLQVKVIWDDSGNPDGHAVNPQAISDPVYISVTNEVYYPQWETAVGEGTNIAAFFLKTLDPDLSWQIDIYDTNNAFLQTLSARQRMG